MKNYRILIWASLVLVVIVAVQELSWLNRSSLAWVILLLAVAIGLQAVYALTRK